MNMKTIILGIFMLFLGCNSPNQSGNTNLTNMITNDEDLILRATQEFLLAWNNGDAKASAAFYTEDGIRVGAFGDTQHGRQEIELAYDKLLHQTMVGATVKQERGHVRMLTPDFAVWQGGIEILIPGAASPLKGYVIQIMKKENNKWLILEAHPKLFPPPKK